MTTTTDPRSSNKSVGHVEQAATRTFGALGADVVSEFEVIETGAKDDPVTDMKKAGRRIDLVATNALERHRSGRSRKLP